MSNHFNQLSVSINVLFTIITNDLSILCLTEIKVIVNNVIIYMVIHVSNIITFECSK